jgi:hypothetical protein
MRQVDPSLGCWDLARWPSLTGEKYTQSSLEGWSLILPELGIGHSDFGKYPGVSLSPGLRQPSLNCTHLV